MSIFNTSLTNSICCVLFSRGDGSFHWTIVIPSTDFATVDLFHARNNDRGWFFERKTHDVYHSATACVIVKIGTVTPTNTVERVANLVKDIPMAMPLMDRPVERRFTCRVWFKQAVRVLAANGILSCPDVYALEREIIGYGEAQDLKTFRSLGYACHIASTAR